MKIFTPNDIMPFGKNKGLLFKEIYKYEPTYLEWLIINTEDIVIDINAFEELPNPTPLATGAVLGSQTRSLIFGKYSLLEILRRTDNINMYTNVREIKNRMEISGESLPQVRFRFSPEARHRNDAKLNQSS